MQRNRGGDYLEGIIAAISGQLASGRPGV